MRVRLIVLIAGWVAVTSGLAGADPLGELARERRSYNMRGGNRWQFGWPVIYDIEFASQELHIYTSINLDAVQGVTQQQVDALEPIWENGIEGGWNDRYGILHENTYYYDIIYDVSFVDTYQFGVDHYQVRVRPGISQGNPRTTMTLWDTADTGRVAAHEYGHMIGDYDEYSGGATDPSNAIIDPSSLMGSTGPAAVPYDRHYEPAMEWLELKYPGDTFEVVSAPLPISIAIRGGSNSNRFNPYSTGVLPVTILGDENFDVYDIDLLSLGLSGAAPMTKGNGSTISSFKDVNDDEWTDLMVHFGISDLFGVEPNTTELLLQGRLKESTQFFRGSDSISIVGPGDVNGDGFVGQADLNIIISNWGLDNATYEQGDLSGDGVVSAIDYTQVISFLGQASGNQVVGIPEPAGLALVLVGALMLVGRRGKRGY